MLVDLARTLKGMAGNLRAVRPAEPEALAFDEDDLPECDACFSLINRCMVRNPPW
jgi:hypothetical protein